ncbi:nucleic acid-binding protein [Tothia fuscella]|uniref:Nucleic acid-binding protein n=1 Tax=Tothia fuscella TaxID=1048955 RepID=A0A9P4NPH5_9PEZI|nr:nucleic acid-binding protein [Tothia fuscella]
MATATLDESSISLLTKSFSDLQVDSTSNASKISTAAFPSTTYTDAEKSEIDQWVITSTHIGSSTEDAAKSSERLSTLNKHLSTRTTILGSKPSVADVTLYTRLAPAVSKWSAEERTGEMGYHHIVRYLDFVQNSPLVGLKIEDGEKVKINPDEVISVIKPIDAKAEKERKKREKEAAVASAAAGPTSAPTVSESTPNTSTVPPSATDKLKQTASSVVSSAAAAVGIDTAGTTPSQRPKKEKKEKVPKPPKAAPVEKPLSPSLIDLRVGHILQAIQHPNADSLYVSTIACGDPEGTDNTTIHSDGQIVRTVCSGLNGLIPLSEMQGRKIVAVCNLKPVTMRGIKSSAMVLAASPRLKEGEVDEHKGPVELVNVPDGAVAGERIWFEGFEGEPEGVLNPKKKVWEMCQVGFTTEEDLVVGFDVGAVEQLKESGKSGVAKLRTKGGFCSVRTLKGATVR